MVIPFLPALWARHLCKYKAKIFRAPALLKLFELALHPFSLCAFAFRWGEVNSISLFLKSSDGKWRARFSNAECCRNKILNISAKTFNMGAWGKKNTFSSICVCAFQVRIRLWRWACPEALLTLETAMNWSRCWHPVRHRQERGKPWSCYRAPRTPCSSTNPHLNKHSRC